MAPTLEDQDRLIVNKLAYRIGEPHLGDIVMLYYPINPEKSFVKRVIAEEGDTVRIVDGKVYRNDVLLRRRFRAARVPQPRRLGAAGHPRRLLFRDGRSSQQQLRQPSLGLRAEEVHHRQGAAALVAAAGTRGCSRGIREPPRTAEFHPRTTAVSRVLLRVLILNLVVAGRSWCSATRPAPSASSPTASTP